MSARKQGQMQTKMDRVQAAAAEMRAARDSSSAESSAATRRRRASFSRVGGAKRPRGSSTEMPEKAQRVPPSFENALRAAAGVADGSRAFSRCPGMETLADSQPARAGAAVADTPSSASDRVKSTGTPGESSAGLNEGIGKRRFISLEAEQ